MPSAGAKEEKNLSLNREDKSLRRTHPHPAHNSPILSRLENVRRMLKRRHKNKPKLFFHWASVETHTLNADQQPPKQHHKT